MPSAPARDHGLNEVHRIENPIQPPPGPGEEAHRVRVTPARETLRTGLCLLSRTSYEATRISITYNHDCPAKTQFDENDAYCLTSNYVKVSSVNPAVIRASRPQDMSRAHFQRHAGPRDFHQTSSAVRLRDAEVPLGLAHRSPRPIGTTTFRQVSANSLVGLSQR